MRKRCSNKDVPEVERPSGALKESEIEEIRQAYRDGCKGDILIGLRGEERVITMLLPAQDENEAASKNVVERISAKLKEMGCNKCFLVRSCE